MPTSGNPLILIPGAQHGGWCWRKTLAPLRARNHDPYAVTLTGSASERIC